LKFISANTFDGGRGELNCACINKDLYVRGDANGDRKADFHIQIVRDGFGMSAGDFEL